MKGTAFFLINAGAFLCYTVKSVEGDHKKEGRLRTSCHRTPTLCCLFSFRLMSSMTLPNIAEFITVKHKRDIIVFRNVKYSRSVIKQTFIRWTKNRLQIRKNRIFKVRRHRKTTYFGCFLRQQIIHEQIQILRLDRMCACCALD